MASLLKPPMQCHSNLQFPDSRPRACSHRSLFVRRTPTRPRARGQEPHFTQRLVRCGSRVRQRTLRNLGRHVALPRGDEAQRSAAQLVQAGVSPVGPAAALPRVDVDSLELVRPRSVGVEHVALWAMRQLRPPSLLEQLGLSGAQRAAVLGSLVGRMAAPASERAAWHWLRQRSALGELLGCDCETMGRNALQRASDRLLRHRDTIETRLFQRAADLFDLQPTVTLHDRTSTCCEGAADRRPLARRGHSREKRHDCPPLTLGLALDASGFVRRSSVLAGNVAEGGALQAMPTALDAPPEAAVVLDRGLATEGNAPGCASAQRAEQERAMAGQAGARLETALRTLHEGLSRQDTTRRVEKVWQRIGRLQARHPSAAPHCAIDVQADDKGRNATAVAWKRQPLEGSRATHPGVHGPRTNSVGWDAERLWRTCVTRTDLAAVLRSLKSALGPRPIHHRRPACSAGRLCLSVLACQLVQVVRQRLRAGRRPAGRRCAIAWRASSG